MFGFAIRAAVSVVGLVCALTVRREKTWPERRALEVAACLGEKMDTLGGRVGRGWAESGLGVFAGRSSRPAVSVEDMVYHINTCM